MFTQEGELAFPVTQGCGADEVSFTRVPEPGAEGNEPDDAVTITVVPDVPPVDVVALRKDLDALQATVADLRKELDAVPIPKLRDRIAQLEDRVAALEAELGIASPTPGG